MNRNALKDENFLKLYDLIYDLNMYAKSPYTLEWLKSGEYKLFNSKAEYYGNYKTILDHLDTIITELDKKLNRFIVKDKKCYIASVCLLDGIIEESYSFKEFFNANCLHANVFSKPQLEKIENYENVCFIVVNGLPKSYRYHAIPNAVVNKVMEQIRLI